jgi:hypothetical protein
MSYDSLFTGITEPPVVQEPTRTEPKQRKPIIAALNRFFRIDQDVYAVLVVKIPQQLRVSHNAFDKAVPGAKVLELFGGGWTERVELKGDGPLAGMRAALVAQGMVTFSPKYFDLSHNELGETVATLKPEVVEAITAVER